jgi:hypothetical protein
MVFVVYLLSFSLALFLLWAFRSRHWYLHALAIAGALALGFVQIPEKWRGANFDIALGAVIVFLLAWGIGGLVTLHAHRREKHA